ncbi:MAG: methionine sulfoxide reductase heme-binding subunit [Frankiaceae bacterium]|jgi:predicted ferric reductase|nr:methionine sulfoxide reductase heme-binding subunit [Frankiaceae bacterium]
MTGFSTAPLWYATRGTAIVAFVLLTVSMFLGIAATQRSVASRQWPRFATQDLHRNVSLLALAFMTAHIVTTLLDTFVYVGWWSLVVPGTSPYRRFWVALGTVAFDVILVVVASSLVRHRLPLRWWRAMHWSVYAVWPLAFVHFLETGTDAAHGRFGLWLDIAALLALLVAVAVRLSTRNEPSGPLRSVAGRPQ